MSSGSIENEKGEIAGRPIDLSRGQVVWRLVRQIGSAEDGSPVYEVVERVVLPKGIETEPGA